MATRNNKFGRDVLCISNRGYRASLIVRRFYRRLAEAAASPRLARRTQPAFYALGSGIASLDDVLSGS